MKNQILMLGNLPCQHPNSIGGANTYTDEIYKQIIKQKTLSVRFLHLRKRWFKYGQLIDYITLPFKILWIAPKYKIISIHATWDFHITIGPFVVLFLKLFNKKVVYHFFGGKFHEKYEKMPFVLKKWIDYTIFKSDFKLMETKRMINYFENRNQKNFIWFPNSRLAVTKTIQSELFEKKFVFISRVTKAKGIDQIIDVAKLLPKDYILDIYGPLDDSFYTKKSFGENVNYKGVLKPSEVVNTLKNYNVLLLPTFYKGEGYPGIFIEALSIGIPVITTNWNALDEIIHNDVNGKLIEIKSTVQLEEAILFFNHDNYKTFSDNAFHSFKNFDIGEVSKKLINLYLV